MSSNTVLEGLRHEILTGCRQPGTALLQSEIAAQYGVSRIPVRDAIATLAIERLVTSVPNIGAHVIQLSYEELLEIFELRITLECRCIILAADYATAPDIEEVEYQLQKSNLEAGRIGWKEGDWGFHKALYNPANRPHHMRLIHELRQICQVHTKGYDNLTKNTDHWLEQHEQLVKVFKNKDSKLCEVLLRQHLTQARDYLME